MKLICPTCGASASLPLEMTCRDHRPRLVPERIQLRRTKGWRKPDNAVIVARPSRWGNPFPVAFPFTPDDTVRMYRDWIETGEAWWTDSDGARHRFRGGGARRPTPDEIRNVLRGRDLACWCPAESPCHADVLLDLANRP